MTERIHIRKGAGVDDPATYCGLDWANNMIGNASTFNIAKYASTEGCHVCPNCLARVKPFVIEAIAFRENAYGRLGSPILNAWIKATDGHIVV